MLAANLSAIVFGLSPPASKLTHVVHLWMSMPSQLDVSNHNWLGGRRYTARGSRIPGRTPRIPRPLPYRRGVEIKPSSSIHFRPWNGWPRFRRHTVSRDVKLSDYYVKSFDIYPARTTQIRSHREDAQVCSCGNLTEADGHSGVQ